MMTRSSRRQVELTSKNTVNLFCQLIVMGMANDKTMVVNAVEPNDDDMEQENEENSEPIEEIEDETNKEFASLNAQLDQLNSVLDKLEMKNDVIRAEFVKLLKSNKETRQEFQESVKNEGTPPESNSKHN